MATHHMESLHDAPSAVPGAGGSWRLSLAAAALGMLVMALVLLPFLG